MVSGLLMFIFFNLSNFCRHIIITLLVANTNKLIKSKYILIQISILRFIVIWHEEEKNESIV